MFYLLVRHFLLEIITYFVPENQSFSTWNRLVRLIAMEPRGMYLSGFYCICKLRIGKSYNLDKTSSILLQTPRGAEVDPRWPDHLQRVPPGHRTRLRRRLGRHLHCLPTLPQAISCVSALYRVTHQVEPNFPLTSKQKFCFGLARPGQSKTELLFWCKWEVWLNRMCHPALGP